METMPKYWFLTWVYGFTFFVLSVVLLLNMLIAMMSKTFDTIWETSQETHQLLFARLVTGLITVSPEPPPLNMLRMPAYFLNAVLKCLHLAAPGNTSLQSAHEFVAAGFDFSALRTTTSFQRDAVSAQGDTGEYVGVTVAGRNSFKVWLDAHPKEELAESLFSFFEANESPECTEERWKKSMHGMLVKQQAAIEALQTFHQLKQTTAKFRAVVAQDETSKYAA